MNIVFRVDASLQIGSGHVMRCLTLADELHRRGVNITFICREHVGHMIDLIEKSGYSVERLPQTFNEFSSKKDDVEHASLLGLTWEQDAIDTITTLKGKQQPEWLIIDHYALDYRWEKMLRSTVDKIMVIDDLADRNHDCNIMLDQNLYYEMELRYNNLVPQNCRKLIGPRYALLRPEFSLYRKNLRNRNGQIERILVFFGGMDAPNITYKALHALSNLPNHQFKVDVVVGSGNPHKEAIRLFCAAHNDFNYYCQTDNMAKLMSEADLSIGAGGSTTWERCALGLPAIIVSLAKNQSEVSSFAAECGISFLLGDFQSVSSETIEIAVSAFLLSPKNLLAYSKKCLKIIDANGTQRVAKAIIAHQIKVRLATIQDSDAILEWRNSETTRKHIFSPELIPKDVHREWFLNSLKNPNRVILIGEINFKPIGVLRYDISSNEALVSVYLIPNNIGKGIGTELIASGSIWLKKNRPLITLINAQILSNNIASKKVFKQAEYEEHHITFQKVLK
jgi:UDP-2,4-diacetamido-2,4,6-trideoxy-beta-L-altropyranose hydrolase